MRLLDLCAGIGGFSLGAHWAGWSTEAFCEKDSFCQKVLAKNFPGVPIYNDVFTFPSESFHGRVDAISAGFPCQPFSSAGKRKGRDDERHIFPAIVDIVASVRPTWCVFENVRGLLSIESGRLFSEIISSLEGQGFEVITFCVPASALGAPHRRDRLWIVAHSARNAHKCHQGAEPRNDGEMCRLSETQCESEYGAFVLSGAGGIANHSERSGRPRRSGRAEAVADSHGADNGLPEPPNSYDSDAATQGLSLTRPKPAEHETNAGCGTQHSYCDDSDAHEPRLQRDAARRPVPQRETPTGYGGQSDRIAREWREPWIEAATRLCTLDDGLPRGLVRPKGWRVNALKAAGNSIVPGIAFEIFRAIASPTVEQAA